VRVNRRSKPALSIRYVLSADRKLQKLSLRRISVPAKKARKARKATRSIRPTIRPKSPALTTDIKAVPVLTPRAVFAGAICVMAVALLIAARQPSSQTDVASISAPPTAMPPAEIALPKAPIAVASSAVIASTDAAAAPAQLETKKTVPPKPVAAAVARPSAADASTEKTTSAESVKAMPAESVSSAPKAHATTSNAAVVESTSNVAGQTATSVTITGCVANDEATFWLKDTSGADAPRSRNWKSGFLRKRPAPIELLDATHALRLPNYVGQRVAATGTLVNREMRAQSLQRVGSSCS
jgi:hypothetical protein